MAVSRYLSRKGIVLLRLILVHTVILASPSFEQPPSRRLQSDHRHPESFFPSEVNDPQASFFSVFRPSTRGSIERTDRQSSSKTSSLFACVHEFPVVIASISTDISYLNMCRI